MCLAIALGIRAQEAELRKPPPDPKAQPYRERLEALVKVRYPHLWTEKANGLPVVTVLLDSHGELVHSNLETLPPPASELTASEGQFARFGLTAGDLRYVGEARIELPLNTVFVVFGGMGSSQIDRALVAQYFPKEAVEGAGLNKGIWILFDHQGRVVRSGEEHFEPATLRKLLEARYPGIETSDMTANPVLGRDGHPIKNSSQEPLQLYCVWLADGSPLPKS
jgi:hypothetical protein